MIKHNATRILTAKGWLVADACERWGIRIETYNARCNNPKLSIQLEDMCRGIPNNLDDEK